MSRVALTYKDYAALPDDGRRYQILDGELCVTPVPSRLHQKIVGNLHAALHHVLFVANDRFGVRSDRGIDGAPTLAVEILWPSTAQTDRSSTRESRGPGRADRGSLPPGGSALRARLAPRGRPGVHR